VTTELGQGGSDKALQAVWARLASGEPARAAGECRTLLAAYPQDADVRHVYGRCLAALGRIDEAVIEFRGALTTRKQHFPALVDLGVAYTVLGKHRDAQQVLLIAQGLDPQPAEVHFALGLCSLGLGELETAERRFREAISRNRHFPDAYNNLGVVLDRRGRLADAVECFRQAVAAHANFADAYGNLGGALLRLGKSSAAAEAFQAQAVLTPDDARVHASLGAALLAANDFVGAARALEHALALDGNLAEAAAHLGTALYALKRPEQAEQAFRRSLGLNPNLGEARFGLGRISAARGEISAAVRELMAAQSLSPKEAALALLAASALDEVGCLAEAIAVLQVAAKNIPSNAEVHDALGKLLHRAGRISEALASYERALAIDKQRVQTFLNRGHALESLGSYSLATESFERALALRPPCPAAIAGMASCAFRVCDWERGRDAVAQLRALPEGLDHLHPFLLLSIDCDPEELAQLTRRRARAIAMGLAEGVIAPYSHERLRIAYVSPDFRDHAVAHCIAGVIERHDRRDFEVIGVSLSAADGSAVGARLAASFDELIDGSSLTDEHLVSMLRSREIDIAVDLAGYTVGARSAIFARRLAPVQVNYLGFPGSLGANFMDFILADETVVPTRDEHLYTERVLRLPNSYLPFDCARPLPVHRFGRADVGLPSEGFIFCAFNNGYKITREVFEVWLALLREVPGSVLWLRGAAPATEANLRRSADAQGILPQRLVFAPFLKDPDEHLARLQLADLFLDTLPYNAHSTAAEALWAGVPVVTCLGRTFAARVGASLVSAAGLTELISGDLSDYHSRALDLARRPSALQEIRERLVQNRGMLPLFDTAQYTRNLEATLWAVCQRGASRD
jgi:protein O-GlcNAc transferase